MIWGLLLAVQEEAEILESTAMSATILLLGALAASGLLAAIRLFQTRK